MTPAHSTFGSHATPNIFLMRRHKLALVFVFMVALLLGLGVTELHAQGEYMGVFGLPPDTTALPVENGFFDLSQGSLRLEFPLGSWPQRGHGSYTATLDGATLTTSSDLGGTGPGDYEDFYDCESEPDVITETITYTYWWHEANGTAHEFDVVFHETHSTVSCGGSNVWYGWADSFSNDGTGYRMVLETGNKLRVYAPDGTTVHHKGIFSCSVSDCVAPKDSNGNYYSTTGYPYTVPTDTLGRAPVITSVNGSTATYHDVLDSRGSTRRYTVNWYSWSCGTNCTGRRASSISLPDGTSYTFGYESPTSAVMTSMTLPTGATVYYSWSGSGWNGLTSFTRTTSDGTWTYVNENIQGCNAYQPTKYKVTVTKPSGDQSVYYFTKNGGGWLTQVDYFTGAATTGTLLASVNHSYTPFTAGTCSDPFNPSFNENIKKAQTTTTLPVAGGSVKQTIQYCYDEYGMLTETREWKFYTGNDKSYDSCASSSASAVDRITRTTYLRDSSYVAKTILNRVASVTVTDGAGNIISKTVNTYDGGSLTSVTGVANHDDTDYDTSNTVRGNLTKIERYISGGSSSCTSTTCLTKTMTYDTTGQVLTETDWHNGTGNTTTYNYSDSDKFYTDAGDTSSLGGYSPSVTTNTYPKTVTAGGLTTTYGYYWGTGQVAKLTDPNGQTTYFHFYDPLNRPTSTKLPNSGWTYTQYPNANQIDVGTGITSTTLSTSCTGSTGDCRSDRTILDSLGHISAQKLRSDPDGETTVDTAYDSNSRQRSVSNPHRSASASTDGTTTFYYDGLDRLLSAVQSDNRAALTVYGAAVSGAGGSIQQGSTSTYGIGYPILSVDEGGKPRQFWYDGLGRLIEVDEPTASSSGATSGSANQTVTGSEQSSPNGGTPGTGSVTISGEVQTTYYWDDCANWVYDDYVGEWVCEGDWVPEPDSGWIRVTVNGSYKQVNFTDYDDTAQSLAAELASTINADSNFPVSASASGATITLTSKAVGSSSNYSLSASVLYQEENSFTATPSGSTLTGGQTYYQYDAGTVSITVNGLQMSTTYGQSSTTNSVASSLAGVINANNFSPVTASVSSAVITLTAKTTGTASNYTVSTGSSTNYPSVFSSPSFSISVSNLANGTNTGGMSSPLVTLYTYDLNDNLTSVTQGSQTRAYTYDKLSRLTQISNPEVDGTTYLYYTTTETGSSLCSGDPGWVCLRKRAAPNQTNPSTTITTTYTYDALNRLTGIDYPSGDSTPDVTYSYDSSSCLSLSECYNKGRRTGMTDGAGSASWAYDKLGNVWRESRTINSQTKTISYTYNLDSSIATMTYPGGRTITYTTKGAQRQTKAEDTTNSIVYAQTALYAAHGGLSSLTNGASNQIFTTAYYNKRLQPCRIAVNGSGTAPDSCTDTNSSHVGNVMDLQYDFGLGVSNNGNVKKITDKRTNMADRSTNYIYDALNRIKEAYTDATSGSYCWGETFTIDALANLTNIAAKTSTHSGCTQESGLSVTVTSQNRFSGSNGYSYDAAGNLTGEPSSSASYTYDAENMMTQSSTGAGTIGYVYDGDGMRVQKTSSGSAYKLYWFDIAGNVITETDGSGSTTNGAFREYVYFGGQRIAVRDSSGNMLYYFTDHLGTTRTMVQAGQTSLCYDADYYPYGGTREYTTTCDQNYKFTGQERDGLDYFVARQFTSRLGRFLAPDEAFADQDPTDPQSWNLYGYVRNNPLNFIDPTGRKMECHWETPPPDDDPSPENGPPPAPKFKCTVTPDPSMIQELDAAGRRFFQARQDPRNDNNERVRVRSIFSAGTPSSRPTSSCGASALGYFALHAGPEALNLIPLAGPALSLVAGYGVNLMDIPTPTGVGATGWGMSAAQTAQFAAKRNKVAIAKFSSRLAKGIPIVGGGLTAAQLIINGFQAHDQYQKCMAGVN